MWGRVIGRGEGLQLETLNTLRVSARASGSGRRSADLDLRIPSPPSSGHAGQPGHAGQAGHRSQPPQSRTPTRPNRHAPAAMLQPGQAVTCAELKAARPAAQETRSSLSWLMAHAPALLSSDARRRPERQLMTPFGLISFSFSFPACNRPTTQFTLLSSSYLPALSSRTTPPVDKLSSPAPPSLLDSCSLFRRLRPPHTHGLSIAQALSFPSPVPPARPPPASVVHISLASPIHALPPFGPLRSLVPSAQILRCPIADPQCLSPPPR